MDWQHPNPFIIEHNVTENEIDRLGHVNNKKYLDWMEHIAWEHSLSVGINENTIKKLNKAMVIGRHEMNFHAACYLSDVLNIGTWVASPSSSRKRIRFYQIIREYDQKTVFTGQTLWICMDLETKRSTSIPDEFITPYTSQK